MSIEKVNGIAILTWIVSVVFWLAESWFFGWNQEPCCYAELICDRIALTGFYGSAILSIGNVLFNTKTEADGK